MGADNPSCLWGGPPFCCTFPCNYVNVIGIVTVIGIVIETVTVTVTVIVPLLGRREREREGFFSGWAARRCQAGFWCRGGSLPSTTYGVCCTT